MPSSGQIKDHKPGHTTDQQKVNFAQHSPRLDRDKAQAVERSICGSGVGYVCSEVAADSNLVQITSEEYSFYVPKVYVPVPEDTASDLFVSKRFQSADGLESLSIVRRLASSIRPTFFQVSDISNYGDVQEVAKLIIPKQRTFIASSSRTIAQVPVDTKTPRGVVTLPDITIYSYQFQTGNGYRVWISAGATRGNVFLLATSTTKERFMELESTFKAVHDSFQLFRKIDV